MHIVNDNSRTFDIRLGGEARVPVSRELILALAAKKKQLLALCESTLRTPRCERERERERENPISNRPCLVRGEGGG